LGFSGGAAGFGPAPFGIRFPVTVFVSLDPDDDEQPQEPRTSAAKANANKARPIGSIPFPVDSHHGCATGSPPLRVDIAVITAVPAS